jgi:type I restriction enzyme S subunit
MFFDLDWFLREEVRVPPTVEEQECIAAVLAVADREIDLLKHELELLKNQKRGLMQKLMTGEIRVKA